MEPHRPPSGTRARKPSSGKRATGRASNRPLDAAWLEQAALRYAAKWETTEQGVRDALERKLVNHAARNAQKAQDEDGFQSEGELEALRAMIPQVAAGLVERGYVDDRRFAEQLVARLERQGRSSAYLASKLRTKGVAEEIIEEMLSASDPDAELQAAWRLAKKRRLGPYCLDAEKRADQRDKHLGILGRQGFSIDLALRVIDADAMPEGD